MRSKLLAILAVAAFAFAACGDDQPTVPDVPDLPSPPPAETPTDVPPAVGQTVSVSAQDNFFDPDSLVGFESGSELTVEFTNDGNTSHTFTIDEVDADTGTIGPGASATVTFTVPDEGVVYYCTIHGKSAMFGQLQPRGGP